MKKFIILVTLIGMALPMSGLSAAKEKTAKIKSKVEVPEIQVLADGNCAKPCIVIGKISRIKHTVVGDCSTKLKKYAQKEHGADAVLLYKLVPTGAGPLMCEGVAVRWAKEGETGIAKISDDTVVPVLAK